MKNTATGIVLFISCLVFYGWGFHNGDAHGSLRADDIQCKRELP